MTGFKAQLAIAKTAFALVSFRLRRDRSTDRPALLPGCKQRPVIPAVPLKAGQGISAKANKKTIVR